MAARLHLHGAAGEYLPPKGYHRTVNGNWFEDNYGEFVNGYNQYAYIPGQCVADLPLGEVFVEICRGYEVRPLRTRVTVTPQTDELTFELERVLHWPASGRRCSATCPTSTVPPPWDQYTPLHDHATHHEH